MNRIVVDASVAAKWMFPEIHTDEALRLLEAPHELWAPDLLYAEVGNVVWKKIGRGEVRTAESRAILSAIRRAPLRVHPAAPLLEIALDVAILLRLSVYDSLYLALALSLDCPLVTADRRMFNTTHSEPSFARHIRWVEDQA